MEINDSPIHSSPNVDLEGVNKVQVEDVEEKHVKSEPLNVNPLFEEFSNLNDDSTSL